MRSELEKYPDLLKEVEKRWIFIRHRSDSVRKKIQHYLLGAAKPGRNEALRSELQLLLKVAQIAPECARNEPLITSLLPKFVTFPDRNKLEIVNRLRYNIEPPNNLEQWKQLFILIHNSGRIFEFGCLINEYQ